MLQKILKPLVIVIFSTFLFYTNGFSFSIVKPAAIEKNVADFRASEFVKLSAKDYASLTGRKLNFFEKIYFKIVQKQVKRDLKKNPDLLMSQYLDNKTGKFKFSALWFVIAAFIGPLGVLLAYVSHPQKKDPFTKRDKTNSAWLGFALFLLWFGFTFIF